MNEYELHTQGARHAFEPTREDGLDVNRNKAPGASEAGAVPKPYAYEFAKSNGDGTYSVVIERGDVEQVGPRKYEYAAPKNALKEHAVKPLYDHPAPVEAGAVPVGEVVPLNTKRPDILVGLLNLNHGLSVGAKLYAAPPSAPAAESADLELVYAVYAKGERIAIASLQENAEYAARNEPGARVVPCRLVPTAATADAQDFRHNAAGPADQAIYDGMAANYHGATADAQEIEVGAEYVRTENDSTYRVTVKRASNSFVDYDGDCRGWSTPEEFKRAYRRATADAQLSGNSGELDAQGDERAADESNPFAGFDSFNAGYRAALSRQPSASASVQPVAYLDIGVGGYMDVGTELTDKQLSKLPSGRHMLGIIGTYGIDGYKSASALPERDASIRKVVGLCNRLPGATTWNSAEFMYDEIRAALAAAKPEGGV